MRAELATVELVRRLPIDPWDTINAPCDDELRQLFAGDPAYVIVVGLDEFEKVFAAKAGGQTGTK